MALIMAATFCLGDSGCLTLLLRVKKDALSGEGLASVLVLLPEAFFESEPVILNPLSIFIFHTRILWLREAETLNEEGKKVVGEQRRGSRA